MNIMLRLENIRLINGIIYADVIPISDEDKPFKIEIDPIARRVIKHTNIEVDSYVIFAFSSLMRYYDSTKSNKRKKLPKRTTVAFV